MAAGVVFYGLLALFPAITALVSLYGLFANASTINEHLSGLGGILPSSAVDIVHEQVARLPLIRSWDLVSSWGLAWLYGVPIPA